MSLALISRCSILKNVKRFSHNQNLAHKLESVLVPTSEVERFISECMAKVGTPKRHAKELADVLVAADRFGHFSHGLNRLEFYLKDVSTGMCNGNALPTVVKETSATAFIDGKNGLGPVVGNFAMDVAMKKAKEAGVGWVVATNSNHYGIAGWYSRKAMEVDLIGLSFTNTSPFLSPTRSKAAALGTNPITVAARGASQNDEFVLDMATTAVAVGKIELQRRKGEAIPAGWAQDSHGKITTDPSVAMAAGCIMPLGGSEVNSGYKGYGLAVMVELFCGMLGGGAYGPNIRKWMTASTPAKLSQCFIAIDPSCFAPGFKDRLSHLIQYLRNMEPVEASHPVLVAGDPEIEHLKKVEANGGIHYHVNQWESSKKMAAELGVEEMKAIS